MIIKEPGFYISKAGKCEVVDVRKLQAIGWNQEGTAFVWRRDDGHVVTSGDSDNLLNITGPWVDPRKPVEAWLLDWANGSAPEFFTCRMEALEELQLAKKDSPSARLVHLREVED